MTEKIDSVEQRMTEKIDSVEQRMIDRQDTFKVEILELFQQSMETTEAMIQEAVAQGENRTRAWVEVRIGSKIDALYEGLKSANEAQAQAKQETEALEQRVDNLETRVSSLENKTPA